MSILEEKNLKDFNYSCFFIWFASTQFVLYCLTGREFVTPLLCSFQIKFTQPPPSVRTACGTRGDIGDTRASLCRLRWERQQAVPAGATGYRGPAPHPQEVLLLRLLAETLPRVPSRRLGTVSWLGCAGSAPAVEGRWGGWGRDLVPGPGAEMSGPGAWGASAASALAATSWPARTRVRLAGS